MKGGYVKIYRRLFDHDVFDSFGEAAMFVDFIARAAWADATVSYKGRYLGLTRGQFSMSLRDMAERYDTSVGSVRRRLVKWEKHGLIQHASGAVSGNGVNVITVCNYDKYQFADHRPSAGGDTQVDTLPPTGSAKSPRARSRKQTHRHSPAETRTEKTQLSEDGEDRPSLARRNQQANADSSNRNPAPSETRDRADRAPAAHLCPENFAPNDANKAYAKECGFSRADFDRMAADMKDWSRAAPGQKGLRNDWQAMFRRWMRREVQARAPNVVPLHGTQATGRQI